MKFDLDSSSWIKGEKELMKSTWADWKILLQRNIFHQVGGVDRV